VLRELSEKESQLILNDIGNENQYDKDYNKLEVLISSRIAALYSEGEKNRLSKLKEKTQKRLKFRADFLEIIGDRKEEVSEEFIYNYRKKGLEDGKKAGQAYLNG
jgi:hypothetical protein